MTIVSNGSNGANSSLTSLSETNGELLVDVLAQRPIVRPDRSTSQNSNGAGVKPP